MKTMPVWQFNEFQPVGVDYADQAVAEQYDGFHQRFRGDMGAEADRLLDELGVLPGQTLIDLGCGTGTFAIQAARRCARVYAADVSDAMLAVARRKADAAGVRNIYFAQEGFLTYAHPDAPVDFLTSTAALHHLPDFWKYTALRRIHGMVKEGGLFYLLDTVYSFPADDYARFFAEKTAWFTEHTGEEFGQDVIRAFSEEFCTIDWIMEGLLMKAGFTIERADYPDGM
ncbi:MAG TPA: class I SAM-dependent methyltransferase, partial [Armatimonadota bacterium]